MSEQLIKHFARFVEIKEANIPGILSFFQPISLLKKENLLREGSICTSHYFVVKGCLRLFFVNEKGVEQTIQFALENWWLTDYMAFQNQQVSNFYIQAVEKTEVLAISLSAQEQLFLQFPPLEKYFRLIYQRAYAASQLRIKYLYHFSREELYEQFITAYPEFIQRIPQYLLASFLGFTPEYLSELRKKKRS
ncbi:Crp/Fnr family transcriptional regulator [Adhaeribacter radiodurans]|uniref:Crp/Fnr family transcriptional regulator n=1 Tax=Adhaeribacter radiodurans TaxID=2745197 RepID=A0A7L7LEF8_9BACT|nr:Crp/Fnr family transcriptional regulator [Adhaeribacter radiodurans]QMU31201.1 Crp/Fnr family transcriptional regulator [Adhaeribacter radiodurans]